MVTTTTTNRGLLTVPQAMGHLMCSRTTIYKLVAEGKLEAVKIGKLTRITERSLNSLIDGVLSGDIKAPSIRPGDDDDRDDRE